MHGSAKFCLETQNTECFLREPFNDRRILSLSDSQQSVLTAFMLLLPSFSHGASFYNMTVHIIWNNGIEAYNNVIGGTFSNWNIC